MRIKTITAACALAAAACLALGAPGGGRAQQATGEGNTFDSVPAWSGGPYQLDTRAGAYVPADTTGNIDVAPVRWAEWNTMVPEAVTPAADALSA
ncbi:hypothetical protein ABH931_007038 [Streptacidiphilus sp. MAP12-33]|uniref:hypothetical protein n=1 Tax=Streptacidiphilus sp. MAP12-33 TaxID=3156266 RepID=UPI0035161480